MEFNNRELAALIWLGIAFAWALTRRDIRTAIPGLLRSFLAPQLFSLLLAFAAWVAGSVWIAERVGLWEGSLLNETVFWFLASGGALFFGVTRAFGEEGFLRETAGRVLKVGVLAELFVNLIVLPLWAELILLPILTFLLMTQVFVTGKAEHEQAKKFLDGLIGWLGFGLLIYVVVSVSMDPNQLDLAYLWRLVAMPVWLTLACLPFIYLLSLWVLYEKAFKRITFFAEHRPGSPRKAKLAMFKRFHLRGQRLRTFNGTWQKQLLEATATGDTKAVFHRFDQEQQAAA